MLDGTMQVRELRGANSYATYLIGARGPEYRRDESSGIVRWYLFDGLGSVLGELDPSGNITASRKFDVYGGVRSSAGTSTSKHKFCGSLGHPSDDESGLVYMRARYMDPVTGRFVSEDPDRSGSNYLPYTPSDPTNLRDASGRDSILSDEAWFEQMLACRFDFEYALSVNASFRVLAFKFLVGWTAWVFTGQGDWYSPGHELRAGLLVANLWGDFAETTSKPPFNPMDAGAFYTGYAACLMITALILDDDLEGP